MTLIQTAGAREGNVLSRPRPADPSSRWRDLGKLIFLLLFGMSSTWANTCTPYSAPANGPYPAIPANGIDAINWGIARVQWTTDNAANYYHEIRFGCTGAGCPAGSTWGGTSARSSYPLSEVFAGSTATVTPLGSQLANLLPNMTYHVLVQSSPDNTNWCTATDQSFTTLSKPAGRVLPQLPQKVVFPTIAYNGTHWVYGSNCGTGGLVQANVQDCFNRAQPGDDIGFPAGKYPMNTVGFPADTNHGIFNITCSQTANNCTQSSGTVPANGAQIILWNAPAPINSGIPYYVVNSNSGSGTFQISYDGTNPITFTTYPSGFPTGIQYRLYPITQPYIYIHSTAASNLLPPPGVRLGPDALAQYLPNMPQFVGNDPTQSGSNTIFYFNPLAAGYYFQNVVMTVDTSIPASYGNGVDPLPFYSLLQMSPSNYNFIWDQCAFMAGATPARSIFADFSGSNVAVINSFQNGLDYWQPYIDTGGNSNYATLNSSGSTLTFPATTASWPGSDGTSATKHQCVMPSASITITGGTASGSAITWIDPSNCTWVTQVPTGITATGTNMTVQVVATPAVPTYGYNSPTYCSGTYPATCGYQMFGWTVIPWDSGGMAIVNGVFTNAYGNATYYGGGAGSSKNHSQGAAGFEFSAGRGPFAVMNTYQQGADISGVFVPDDLTGGNTALGNGGCPGAIPCNPQFMPSNITHQRSTVTTNPCYFRDSACWNGANYNWRNMDEIKQARYVLQDGDIFGPYYAQTGTGECTDNFNRGVGTTNSTPAYIQGGDWTFTNNTCITNVGLATGDFAWAWQQPYPALNFYVHNNLFVGMGFGGATAHPALGDHYDSVHTDGGCIFGAVVQWGGWVQNAIFDHNTVFGRAGCQPYIYWQYGQLSSGISVTNNILDMTGDVGGIFNSQGLPSMNQDGPTKNTPDCTQQNGVFGAALFACMNYFTWASNAVLPTYATGYSLTEWNSSQISTMQGIMPAAGTYWVGGTTLANRLNTLGWFNNSTGNYRLKPGSPYVSGAHLSTDGPDMGVDMDALEAAQGKVSNVRTYGTTSTGTTIAWYAPDSFSCSVDWGTTPFWSGAGTWTRVPGSGTARIQSLSLTGLAAHSQIYYRVNCAVQQPTGSVQLP